MMRILFIGMIRYRELKFKNSGLGPDICLTEWLASQNGQIRKCGRKERSTLNSYQLWEFYNQTR